MIGGLIKAAAVVVGIAVGLLVVAAIATAYLFVACMKWGYEEMRRLT